MKLTTEEILQWAESQEIPDITILAMSLDAEDLTPSERRVLAVNTLRQVAGWPIYRKAALAGVSEKTWRLAFKRPRVITQAAKVAKQLFGQVALQVAAVYAALALAGDRIAAERIMEETGIITKPEKAGVTINNSVSVVEIREKLEQNRREGLSRFGYTVPDSD